ncbi:MAG: hypothetical protein WC792_00670 [Candidatus Micrarchaeia archaeon]
MHQGGFATFAATLKPSAPLFFALFFLTTFAPLAHAGSLSQHASGLQISRDFAPMRAIANLCLPYQYEERLTVPVPEAGLEEFSESISLAGQAQKNLETARESVQPFDLVKVFTEKGATVLTLAALLKNAGAKMQTAPSAVMGPFALPSLAAVGAGGAFFLAWELNECNQKAHLALRNSAQSAALGLQAVEKKLALVDAACGGEEAEGQAGGVKLELAETMRDLREKNTRGASLGGKIANASGQITSIEEKMRQQPNYWPDELPETVFGLVSSHGSALSAEMDFARKADAALASLEQELGAAQSSASEAKAAAESAIERLENEKVSGISRTATQYAAVEKTQMASTQFSGGFADRLASATRALASAGEKEKQAAQLQKLKTRGWLCKTIALSRNAFELCGAVSSESAEILRDARELERALAERAEMRFAEVSQKNAVAAKSGLVFAAFFASMLEKERQKQIPDAPLGKRVNALADKLGRLSELENELDAGAPNSEAVLRVRAKAQSALALAKTAREKDGVDARFEEAQAEEIISSLDSVLLLGPEGSAAILELLDARAEDAETSIAAKAAEDYGAELGSLNAFLSEMRGVLEKRDLEKFLQYEKFFPNGKLDAHGAIGFLSQMRETFSELASGVRASAGDLAAKSVSENLEIRTMLPVAELGVPARVEVEISAANTLPAESFGEIRAPLPIELPSNFSVLRTQGDVRVVRNAQGEASLVFSRVEKGGEYFVSLAFEKILARKISEKEETVFSAGGVVRKSVSIEFSADFSEKENGGKPLGVLVRKPLPPQSQAFVSTLLQFEKTRQLQGNESPLVLLLQAREGKNRLEIFWDEQSPQVQFPNPDANPQSSSQEPSGSVSTPASPSQPPNVKAYPGPSVQNSAAATAAGGMVSLLAEQVGIAQKIALLSQAPQAQEVKMAADAAIQKLGVATTLEVQGDASRAESVAKGAAADLQKSLKETALSSIRATEDDCKAAGLACGAGVSQNSRDARAALDAGKIEKAFSLASSASLALSDAKAAFEQEMAQKRSLIENYTLGRPAAGSLLEDFSNAFELPDASSQTLAKRRATTYQPALDASKLLQKKTAELSAFGAAGAQGASGALAKIPASDLSAKLKEFQGAFSALSDALGEMRGKAASELNIARQLREQYGNSSQEAGLSDAAKMLAMGKTFSAYVAASAVSDELRKTALSGPGLQTGLATSAGTGAAQGNERQMLYAAIGAIILVLLAYLFFKGKKPQTPQPLDAVAVAPPAGAF